MSHLALQRSFLIIRENLGQRMRIDTATGHVLGASVLTTLNDKNRLARGCEGVSSNRTAQPAPTTIASKSDMLFLSECEQKNRAQKTAPCNNTLLQRFDQGRKNLVDIANDTVVALLEDRCVLVLVNCDDGVSTLNAYHVLHLTGNAESNVSLGSKLKTGNADVEVAGQPINVLSQRTRATELSANLSAEVASHLKVSFLSEATTSANNNVALGEVAPSRGTALVPRRTRAFSGAT